MAESGFEHGLLARLRDLAGSSATPLAAMSMNEIASALGMTRMTLYRKAGTRDQIVTALQGIGIDARRQPDVHERVVTATTALLRDRPIVELTLDLIASEAGCSVPAIHARFGGRQGVLIAVIERHSPLFTMKQLASTELGMARVAFLHRRSAEGPRQRGRRCVARLVSASGQLSAASDHSHACRAGIYAPAATTDHHPDAGCATGVAYRQPRCRDR